MSRPKTQYERAAQFEALRNEGLTYQEIASRAGVSRAYVNLVLSNYKKSQFRGISQKQCVHDGLREWMNENKCSVNELLRRAYGFNPGGTQKQGWFAKLRGETHLKKPDIDRLIDVTGMSYEELFREVANGAEQ